MIPNFLKILLTKHSSPAFAFWDPGSFLSTWRRPLLVLYHSWVLPMPPIVGFLWIPVLVLSSLGTIPKREASPSGRATNQYENYSRFLPSAEIPQCECWSPLTPACKSSQYIFRNFVSQWLNSNSYYWKFKYISIKQIILKQCNKYSSVSLPNYFTRFDYYLCS